MPCIRCGREESLENHHIIERCHGGEDKAENKEKRCSACHDYEHVKRKLLASLEYEKRRGQVDRIRCYEHRLEVLDRLNTVELIRERGTYLSYWTDRSTRYLPRKILTTEEAKEQLRFNSLLEDAMEKERV